MHFSQISARKQFCFLINADFFSWFMPFFKGFYVSLTDSEWKYHGGRSGADWCICRRYRGWAHQKDLWNWIIGRYENKSLFWYLLQPTLQKLYMYILQHGTCCKINSTSSSPLRGEPVVCIPSSPGESLQLPRTLFPPAAHHCCLPGTLSVYDDQVNISTFHVVSL